MGERSELILEIVNDRRVVSYKELAGLLGVSTMTARRECERLSRGGKLVKTIGGVRGLNGEFGYGEKTMDERMGVNVIEKRAIAKKALKLIETPSVVFIDGSTTCVALARLIDAQCDGVTVVTHSLQVCLTIRSGRNSVICAGGEFEPRSLCFVGAQTESHVGSLFIDKAFVSATGFVPTDGTFESAPAAFRVKQVVAQRARDVVLLVDHTKFGRRALSKVFELSQINHVVTDAAVAEQDIAVLREAGIKVTIASTFGKNT